MDNGLADILEACLDQLAAGASVDDCLVAYPAQRAMLEPAIRAAAGLRQFPRPAMPSHTRAALEAQMLARAAARRAASPADSRSTEDRQPWWLLGPSAILAGALRAVGYGGPLSAPGLRIAATAVALVLALLLGAGAYAAARTIVSVFAPAPTPTPIATAMPAPQSFAVEGIVERIDQEAWVVGGATIAIDARTAIVGRPAVGALARVSGVVRADGARLARDVRVDPAPTPRSPAPTVAPASQPAPTLVPTPFAFPTITPSPAPAPAAVPPGSPGDGGNGNDKQCQGQQIGRDEKKCDPKPKPKPNQDKKDNKKDKGKKGK